MNFVEVHDEGTGDDARLVGPADWSIPLPDALPGGGHAAAPARRSSPGSGPSTSTSARPSTGSRLVPGTGRRGRVPRQRGAAPHLAPPTRTSSAIVGSEHRVRPGDIVNLVLPLDKLHLFDGETGLTLAPDVAVVA